MKMQKFFQITLFLAFFNLLLLGCSSGVFRLSFRPTFQSDEQLVKNFEENKSDLFALMQKCQAEKSSQPFKDQIRESFSNCSVEKDVLTSLRLIEVAEEFEADEENLNSRNGVDGGRVLFITDYYKDDRVNTFVEEKGYAYTETPIQQDLIKDGSLDQFSGQLLFEKRGVQEVWKYKQIEPNWYIYYRQYFYPFLG
jgi:hypothetical protein